MSENQQLQLLKAKFCRTVAQNSFQSAEALIAEYSLELKRALEAGLAQADVLGDALRTIEWARRHTAAARAQAAHQLAGMGAAARYLSTGSRTSHTWELRG